MKPSRLLLALTTLVFLFTCAVPAANASAAKKPVTPVVVDTRILVASVDVKASTIEIKYMRSAKAAHRIYKIDDMTILKVNNVSGKISDIKAGMEVGEYIERDYDTLDSLVLSGSGTQPEAAKPKTPPKPKPQPKAPTQT